MFVLSTKLIILYVSSIPISPNLKLCNHQLLVCTSYTHILKETLERIMKKSIKMTDRRDGELLCVQIVIEELAFQKFEVA